MAVQVTDVDFADIVLKSDIPVLLDFWAPWCGPCKALGSVIDELAEEYKGKVLVAKLNVEDNRATPNQYGIRSIPTLVLFKNGEAVNQLSGAVPKNRLVDFIAGK